MAITEGERMTTAVTTTNDRVQVPADLQEKALLGGDLSKLSSSERLSFYNSVCNSLGLNPLTRPFEYIQLNGKLTLYARKDCTEQLRTNRTISVEISSREVVDGVYVVTAKAYEGREKISARCDESIGAVPIQNLQGEAKANAMMKAETKAKRRVTLSICGLGMLDETEIETIPGAKVVIDKPENGPVTQLPPAAVAPPQAQDSSGPYFVPDAETLISPPFPFDPHKGKLLHDESITYKELEDCLWYMQKAVKDPKKAKFQARNEEMALALEAELCRRDSQSQMEEDGIQS
jgi:hypothetical protein